MIRNIFDYIYYRVYSYYKNRWEEANPDIYAIMAISGLPILNAIVIINVILTLFKIDFSLNTVSVILLSLSILVYHLVSMRNIKEKFSKWDNEDQKSKTRKGYFIILYIICSVVLLFVVPLIIYNLNN
jgi:formate hydrogenlyase subunit 3/multisubunit Na+/H+ antiporter MnhD subunit